MTKNYFLTISLSILSFIGFSQDLDLLHTVDTLLGSTLDWDTHGEFSVVNTTNMNLSFSVTKTEETVIGDSEYYFCWGPNCYSPADFSSTGHVAIASGDTNTTFKHYARMKEKESNAGISKIKYCFFEKDHRITEVCFTQTYKVVAPPVGIQSVELENKLSVRNTNNLLFVSLIGEGNTKGSLNIYNTNGALVYSNNITNQLSVNTTDFSSGIYLIEVKNGNNILGRKKIMLLK